jgi:hypothetical protein
LSGELKAREEGLVSGDAGVFDTAGVDRIGSVSNQEKDLEIG